jgi:hypothetical protein
LHENEERIGAEGAGVGGVVHKDVCGGGIGGDDMRRSSRFCVTGLGFGVWGFVKRHLQNPGINFYSTQNRSL